MNGSFAHETLILEPLEKEFQRIGAKVDYQVATKKGRRTGYVDMVAKLGDFVIAVEAEITPRRVLNDLCKAMELQANEFWIVVLNNQLAKAVRSKLLHSSIRPDQGGLFILTLGTAIERVRNIYSNFCVSLEGKQ